MIDRPPHVGVSAPHDPEANPGSATLTTGTLAPGLMRWLPEAVRAVEVLADGAASTLFGLVELACGRGDGSRAQTDAVARAAVQDVESALESGLLDPGQAAAARIAACSRALGFARADADLEGAWTWVSVSLGGAGAVESTLDATGIAVLAHQALSGKVTAQEVLCFFAADVFYTDQHAGYFPDLLQHVADLLIRVVLVAPPTSEAARRGVTASLYWAKARARDADVDALARWCASAVCAQDDADEAAMLLFAAGVALPPGPRREYFHDQYAALPVATSDGLRLQFLAAGVEHDASQIAEALPTLFPLIDAVHVGVDRANHRRERTFGVVAPMLGTLCAAGDVSNALALLRRWCAVEDDSSPGALVMLGHVAEGARWSWPGESCLTAEGDDLRSLTATLNSALGTALVSTVPGVSLPLTPATGRVDRGHGGLLAARTSEALGLADCPDLAGVTTPDTLLVPLPGLPLPYQAVMNLELATAPQLWVSLRTPRPERWVQRVLLFQGETDLAEVEVRLVERVLTLAGIDVEIVTGARVTAAAFRAAYASDDYDVIWVACHGAHPPYLPAAAEVELRPGECLSMDDLGEYAPGPEAEARLLVLNSCDGAVTASANGPRVRGLAARAAAPAQAVVAHQWPVGDGFAATFGALLALGVVETRSIPGAYNKALRVVRQPWSDVAEELRKAGCDEADLQRIAPVGHSYGGNILYWGAPALYR